MPKREQSQASRAKLFELIAAEAVTGIMVFDPTDRQCIYINRLAREVLEIEHEEGAGDIPITLPDLCPKESRANMTLLSPEITNHEGYYQNILMRKTNGQAMIANVSIKFVQFDSNIRATLMMFEDITLQKKLQREVEAKQDEIRKAFDEILEQNKQLKELDHAKDKFIALTTHELRTPLSAIVATAEVLELKLFETDQQRDDFIRTIHEQGMQLMNLVNDILDFAKIRAGKMEFFVEQFDFVPMVTKITSSFDHMAEQEKIKIEVIAPEKSPVMVYADTMRLQEVISNVISNAVKYNKPNGTVTVKFDLLDAGKKARISIVDTGLGIPADKIHHVFNEFETVGHINKHHKGTGLGMPISKRLMQAMGGDLTLESVEKVGSSFFIDLPTEKVLSEEVYRQRADTWGDLAA